MAGHDRALEDLTRGLRTALGDDLVALMLYGSAARGAHVPGRSDVNLLVVLRDASADVLRRAAPALAAWARQHHAPPLIQTEADWAASADVFPIELEDIRDAHRVLAGRDVLSAIRTNPEDLRRELEREARGKLIRLRAAYAATLRDGRALGALLAESVGTFVVLFRAALRLAKLPVPADAAEVVKATGALGGFEAGAFDWALSARAAKKTPALSPDDPIAAAYLAAVGRFVQYVNDA